MIGGVQDLSLEKVNSNGHCIFNGIIMHEFLHALGLRDLFLEKCLVLVLFFSDEFFLYKGFEHEQNREDRDNYVVVNFTNIQSGNDWLKNFKINFVILVVIKLEQKKRFPFFLSKI